MLLCRFKGHLPTSEMVWNDGRHYAHCRRCGVDIMRGRSMVWRTPPAGMRIVWHAATEQDPVSVTLS